MIDKGDFRYKDMLAMAKAMFEVEHPGRNWDTDIRDDEREDWCRYAEAGLRAIEKPAPSPEEQVKAPAPKATDYKPPFARKK